MLYGFERLFDGKTWNRSEVVAAQRARATATAQAMGWPVSKQNLLTDPLDPALVEALEHTYKIRLPAEYRLFLLQVGDGGDCPGLYMRSLGPPFDDSMPWEQGDIYRGHQEPNEFSGNPVPYTMPIAIDPQSATAKTTAGALYLFDQRSRAVGLARRQW